MSRIAEIRKLSRDRFLVCLEDGSQFPLHKKDLSDLGLHAEGELSEETGEKIFRELLPKQGRLQAMALLEKMDRTEHQLREKLRQAFFPPEIIEDAVNYVKSYHYLDDFRYARNYLEIYCASKSLRQMKQELYKKGVAKEIVEQAVEEMQAAGDFPDEEAQILALLEKKQYDPAAADYREQQRIYAFLSRRGYDSSVIYRAMHLNETAGQEEAQLRTARCAEQLKK